MDKDKTQLQFKQINKCLSILLNLENQLYKESRKETRFGLVIHQKNVYYATFASMLFSALGMMLALLTDELIFAATLLSLIFLYFFLTQQHHFYKQRSILRIVENMIYIPASMVRLIKLTVLENEETFRFAFDVKAAMENASSRRQRNYDSIFIEENWDNIRRVKRYCFTLGGLLIFLKRNGVISKKQRIK